MNPCQRTPLQEVIRTAHDTNSLTPKVYINMSTFAKVYRLKCKYCARILLKDSQIPDGMRLYYKDYPDQLFLSWSGSRCSENPLGKEAYASWLNSFFHIREQESYGSITIAKVKCKDCYEELGFIRVYNCSSLCMRGKMHFKHPDEKVRLEKRWELIEEI